MADDDQDRAVDLSADAHGDPDAAPPPSLAPGGLEGARPWRIAESLEVLRKRINELAPGRDKASDGGIGDAAHQSRASDHNPWVTDGAVGVVTARDFTHSPGTGCDAGVIAEALRASRDKRIKYIIWNRRICASEPRDGQPAWAWRPYSGSNPHNHHVHISVHPTKALYDDKTPFALTSVKELRAPAPPAPAAASGRDAEIAAIAEAAEQLGRRAPLLERLTDLTDSADQAVAQEAAALLARYVALTREPPAPEPAAPQTLDQASLADEYRRLFESCQVRSEWQGDVKWCCNKLLQFRPRYETIEQATGVPWYVVGAIHAMESSFNFSTHLHNGDPLTARTVQVPAGRPQSGQPPFTWEESAIDALRGDGLADQADWSLPAILFRLERYNGFRSRKNGINTPYLWSFSNHYSKGKFVKDGVWDPEAVSKQCGAAVMIKALTDMGVVRV